MKSTILFTALLLTLIALPSLSWGQCSEGTLTTNTLFGESFTTQSFTAACDGSLDMFSYRIGNSGAGHSATIEVREGTSCDGNLITSEDITQVEGNNEVSFSAQPMLTAGQTYSFVIKDNVTFTQFHLASEQYLGGRCTINAVCIDLEGVDLVFSYSTLAPVEAVPTMGEWALITFGLIIMSVGVVTVRRREELTNLQAA